MRASAAMLAVVLALTLGVSRAAVDNLNEYNVRESIFDEINAERAGWKELKPALPAYPKADNLVEVQISALSPHRYYVDASSVELGRDKVMRYTTVVKTSGGATNVTYEGIRCETRERKIYALGHADGTWAEPRDPAWRRIERHHPAVYMTLWRDYFCASRTMPTKPQVAVNAIKRGTPLPGGPTAYD